MISNKSYNLITKTVQAIKQHLNVHNIEYDVLGDNQTFAISPTCTIHTQHCTIDIWKNQIQVNEQEVSDLDEMMTMILQVETPGITS